MMCCRVCIITCSFFLWISTFCCLLRDASTEPHKLRLYTMCDAVINMDSARINQAQLNLAIRTPDSRSRVSCDATILPGLGRHVMFYFTDIYLGSPNATESRIDKACIEPREIHEKYEIIPKGILSRICSRNEVDVGSRVYTTDGDGLMIRFYRNRGYGITVHFKIVFTAFRQGSCRTSERKCSNDRCIAHDLVCNEHNPCGDYSDCPTGLEHLSTLEMGGIVVLGLLTGGIIIIMAAVCLQRATSKRYDLDDISIPANGSVPFDHNLNSELDESHNSKSLRRKSSDKCRQTSFDRDSQYRLHKQSPDKEPLYRDYNNTPIDSQSCFNDKNTPLKEDNTQSEEILLSERSSCDTMIHLNNCSPERDNKRSNRSIYSESTTDNNKSSFKCVSITGQADVSPKIHNAANLPDVFHLSSHSLVFSDSDSGSEDDTLVAKAYRKKERHPESYQMKYMMSPMTPSLSQDAVTVSGAHVFHDIKPPPPPYGSLKLT